MDVDLLKSATEDQMEMMMMMQMEKVYEFEGPYPDISQWPSIDSSSGTAPPIFDNTPITSSLINNPLSSISFTSSNVHSPVSLQNPITGRIRNAGELDHLSPSHKQNSVAAMREMIFRIAAMQPIHIDPEAVRPPKRRNVKISKDPQSVAARHRRERISERIRILQRLVPGGTKMDTASMLDEAIHYVKFLKTQVQSLEQASSSNRSMGLGYSSGLISNPNYSIVGKAYQSDHQMFSTNPMLS